MFEQEQYCQNSPLYDSTACIPADYKHINFLLSSSEDSDTSPQSFTIAFQNQFITLGELLEELIKKINMGEKYPLSKMRIFLKKGMPIQLEWTLEQLRMHLCRESASGVTLQAKAVFKEMEDQAAVSYYIQKEPDYQNRKIHKWFLLLNNQQPFFISISKKIGFQKVQQAVAKFLNEFYHNEVTSAHLQFFTIQKSVTIQKSGEDLVFVWQKKKELVGEEVSEAILRAEHEIIGVESIKESGEWPVSEVESEEYIIFFVSNSSKIKLKFSQIANYKVGELLQYLKLEHSNSIGIKIVDEIFPPCKLMKEASKYFKTGDGDYVKNVECRLVGEREMFFSSMEKLKGEFTISKEMVTKKKQDLYDKCRDLAQQRIKQLEKENIKNFTDANEISNITAYTSSIEVIDKRTLSASVFYRTLNSHLRESTFGLVENYSQEWRYKYSASLIRTLRKIDPYSDINPRTNRVTVFRGISGHQLQGKQGQLCVFKEFLSSSKNEVRAKKFATNGSIGTFLEIECISGRDISNFSVYPHEQEVLFMPYTYFRIQQRSETDGLVYIKLKEIRQKEFKSNPATEILWVDDKLKEGESEIKKLNCPMHTTFLHQLKSTAALREWIRSNQPIVKNPQITIAVISNMRRKEDEVVHHDAGAFTAKLVKSQLPNSELIFYIRNIQGTQKALQKHDIDPNNVVIINKPSQLRQFIARWCAPIEQPEDEKEEVINETTQAFFNSQTSSFLSEPSLSRNSTSSKST